MDAIPWAPRTCWWQHWQARGYSHERPAAKYRPGRPRMMDTLSRAAARAHDHARETAGDHTRTDRPWKLPGRRTEDAGVTVDWDGSCGRHSRQGCCTAAECERDAARDPAGRRAERRSAATPRTTAWHAAVI